MAKKITFGPKAAHRIIAGIKKVEREPRVMRVDSRGAPLPPIGRLWAELTAEGTAGHYSWTRKVPTSPRDGTFADSVPPLVVADFTARELNLTTGFAGKIVELISVGKDAGGKDSYEFNAGGGALPKPTAKYQVLQCTEFTDADNFVLGFDYVKGAP